VFAGADWNDDETEVTGSWTLAPGSPHVSRLTPTVSGGSGLLSGEVELEAWVTSVALEDYNTPRSNRSIANPDVDSDDDGVDDGLGDHDYNDALAAALELENTLLSQTKATAESISKRSARTGRSQLSEMSDTIGEVQATVESCSDDVCVTVRENADVREELVQQAQGHVENGEWDDAAARLDKVQNKTSDIIQSLSKTSRGGGVTRRRVVVARGLSSIAPPGDNPLTETERAELVEYLSGSPMVGERFNMCLPDAEVPGGNRSIREEVTPERLFAYLAGQAGDENGKVYSWGYSKVSSENSEDCDDDDPSVRPDAVCGSSPHFVADVSEPVATGGGLMAARRADGHVVVTNSPPSAEGGAPAMVCPVEGEPFEPAGLDAWGKRSDGPPATMEAQGRLLDWTVVQVMVQPPDCPQPVPALLYVSRGLSDGQLIYSGGWVIDDAALYKDSMTALTLAGETQVVGIECCFDFTDDGGAAVLVSRAITGERARRGARVATGSIESLVKAGVMSENDVSDIRSFSPNSYSRNGSSTDGEDGSSNSDVVVTHCPLDAPVLHLVNAGSASDQVKFKAGAELSKSVN